MTHHPDEETRVVERERVVERPVEVERRVEPATPAGQVNVSGGRYAVHEPGPLAYAQRVLSLIYGVIATLLLLRIVLLLVVANQTNAIVDFIYTVTEPFVAPFRGILALDQVSPGGPSVLDVSALVALIGWFLIYLLIVAILRLGDRDRVSSV
jgi:uncharacterized protein YggT (Ycf19 family)